MSVARSSSVAVSVSVPATRLSSGRSLNVPNFRHAAAGFSRSSPRKRRWAGGETSRRMGRSRLLLNLGTPDSATHPVRERAGQKSPSPCRKFLDVPHVGGHRRHGAREVTHKTTAHTRRTNLSRRWIRFLLAADPISTSRIAAGFSRSCPLTNGDGLAVKRAGGWG